MKAHLYSESAEAPRSAVSEEMTARRMERKQRRESCTHPRTTAFTTNHGRHGLRCDDCGMVAIKGDPFWRTLLNDIIRRVRRRL